MRVTGTGVILAIVALFVAASLFLGENDENKEAGYAIAAAVKEYRQKNGRYPTKLADLVPAHLPAVPQAGKYFWIVYAVEPDGSQCWVAYQVHRDRFEEFDCNAAKWSNYEIEDAHVSQHAHPERIAPDMWRKTEPAKPTS